MSRQKIIAEIADTAFWVCSYRAEETSRPDALFKDPLAEMLAGEKGAEIARSMSDSRYAAWTIVLRTCVIDDMINRLIREQGVGRVINLGAGLDTRPYRMDFPEAIQWVEIDHPQLIEFKENALKHEAPGCQLERRGFDLSDRPRRRDLFQQFSQDNIKTLILTEGVIPYLTEAQVAELATDLAENPAFGYWITEYHSKEMYKHQRSKRKNKEMGNSPFQFFPDDWRAPFQNNGWSQKDMVYLYDRGHTLGRPFPLPLWAKILFAVIPEKKKEAVRTMSGFILWSQN